jgi:hypothetical protein
LAECRDGFFIAPSGPEAKADLHMRFTGMLRVSGSLLKLFDRLVEYLDSLEHKTALIPMQWGHPFFKCLVHSRILPSSRIVAEDMQNPGG